MKYYFNLKFPFIHKRINLFERYQKILKELEKREKNGVLLREYKKRGISLSSKSYEPLVKELKAEKAKELGIIDKEIAKLRKQGASKNLLRALRMYREQKAGY